MKLSFIVLTAAILALGSTAQAESHKKSKLHTQNTYEATKPAEPSGGGHKMAGCGLGSLAIEDGSKWSQVGAAFLNATGMQTFGISFGTSNCTEDGVAAASKEKEAFIESNYADLRHDLSLGAGPYLSSLAGLYGCKGDAVQGFGQALQRNQEKILGVGVDRAGAVIEEVVKSEKAGCQA